jgi:hypothetical protein
MDEISFTICRVRLVDLLSTVLQTVENASVIYGSFAYWEIGSLWDGGHYS